MAEKKAKKISDKDILNALREAVLVSIGDSDEGKQAIQKIEQSDDLSKELKTIGRKLVRKKTTKAGVAGLTPKDIEKIKAVATSEKRQGTTKVVKKSSVKASAKKEKSQTTQATQKESASGLIKGIAPVQRIKNSEQEANVGTLNNATLKEKPKLLPKPTFRDRMSIGLFKKKGLWITLLVILIILFLTPLVLLKSGYKSPYITKMAITFDLPVAKINGEKIGHKRFYEDIEALNKFFADETNATSYDLTNLGSTPAEEDLKQLVLERHIRVTLIRQQLEKLGQSVTEEEVQTQLGEITREVGGEAELGKIVTDLYNWTIDEFVQKALRPLLEEERLSIYLTVNEDLNASKEATIKEVAAQLSLGEKTFEELASAVSEDVTSQSGGDLGWFELGTMIQSFEDQVANLEVGEVSEPFKTSFGWHIVKLTDKETGEDGVERYRASHILVDFLTLNEYLSKVRNESDIEILIEI